MALVWDVLVVLSSARKCDLGLTNGRERESWGGVGWGGGCRRQSRRGRRGAPARPARAEKMRTYHCGSAFHEQSCIVLPSVRHNLALFLHQRGLYDFERALDLELRIFRSVGGAEEAYVRRMRAAAYNLAQNAALRVSDPEALAGMDDEEMRRGTAMEKVDEEQRQRRERFERRLQEKADCAPEGESRSILVCRRCGGSDVAWQQKQTREQPPARAAAPSRTHRPFHPTHPCPAAGSADEAMTIFCTCNTCKNRWKM